jgi:arsenate reductase (thioredoxin)
MLPLNRPWRVLFLCTGNSCRSQMAEGWARALHAGRLEACSAGLETHGLNPRAVAVMREAGAPIDGQRSQLVDEFAAETFDAVVTVCSHARETCPVLPGDAPVLHRGFDDPPGLTRGLEDEEQILAVYRRVRDEIRGMVAGLPAELERLRGGGS